MLPGSDILRPGSREAEAGLHPERCREWCWTEPKAAQRRDAAGGGNTQTAGFPDTRREAGCLKLDVVVVLEFFPAACSHPAAASRENSPLDPASWDVSGQEAAPQGQPPLSPSASRHLLLLDFKEGQVPLVRAAGADGGVQCELASRWGSW